ncbi:MAG TPA: uroporphyrinogen decarboxylase family protein [Phycisphaerae bacterium]|nr:uroporphyrinogen decarboxylase family protein [Phycisphaerae bacterium]
MTDLENFRLTVSHRRPGRILYYAGFTPDLERRVKDHVGTDDIGGHYGFYATSGLGLRPPEGLEPLDFSKYWDGEDLPEGTTINEAGVAMAPAKFYHFWGYISPLRNATDLAEIENYPMHDLSDWDDSHMARQVETAHAAGKVAAGWIGHIYETAWQIRGYEPFLMDMIERPEWAACLLGRIAEQNLVKTAACARAGADMLHCGDDVANQNALMFAPEMWRKMMLPLWAKIWAEAKRIHPGVKIWYHSDGNIGAIVEDLVAAGVDVLNPLQPEALDIDDVHRRVGGRVTFDGCLGTQSTMPWSAPDEVRARVKELIDKYGRNGGLILSPTHVLEPEVPLANIDAFVDACREYGTFA